MMSDQPLPTPYDRAFELMLSIDPRAPGGAGTDRIIAAAQVWATLAIAESTHTISEVV